MEVPQCIIDKHNDTPSTSRRKYTGIQYNLTPEDVRLAEAQAFHRAEELHVEVYPDGLSKPQCVLQTAQEHPINKRSQQELDALAMAGSLDEILKDYHPVPFRDFLVDSAASMNLIAMKHLTKKELKTLKKEAPIQFATANGETSCNKFA